MNLPLSVYRATTDVTDSIDFVANLLNIEKQVDDEIEKLARLNTFTSSELTIIRKQFKYLHEQQDSTHNLDDDQFSRYLRDLELRVTENKLALLRSRRLEDEEARIAYRKKLVKLRQLEESQSKDPANFRNQRRF